MWTIYNVGSSAFFVFYYAVWSSMIALQVATEVVFAWYYAHPT